MLDLQVHQGKKKAAQSRLLIIFTSNTMILLGVIAADT